MTWVLSNHSHDLLLDGDPEDQRLEIFDSAFDHIFLLDDVLVSFIEIIGNIRKLQWLPDSLFELVNFVQKLLNVLTRLHLDVVVNADLLNESIIFIWHGKDQTSCYKTYWIFLSASSSFLISEV
jgi:hypothetical protein